MTFPVLSNHTWLLATTEESEIQTLRHETEGVLLTHESLRSHVQQRLEVRVGPE